MTAAAPFASKKPPLGASLEVRGLGFAYGDRVILRDLDFSLHPGELLGVLGPNGAGKSTLFRCILGLERRYSGQVLLEGGDIRQKSPRLMARTIAYVPQTHHPSFNYSVMDMVLMGTAAQGKDWASPDSRQKRNAREALDRLGIADFGKRDFIRLSGGEQQLVLIARALAQQARLLVLDEPTANLDYGNQIRVLLHIRALSRQGYSIIMSTHNPEHAFLFTHRLLALHDRAIAAAGPPAQVLTAGLIRTLYNVEVRLYEDEGGMRCIPVLPPDPEATAGIDSSRPGCLQSRLSS
ncbi:MAG: ABC transporter ATP-binding protein [Spirochaetaceae bacterium]|nr:ABC transporter ATP-binding protein [Spirochaetaceae bacterium]